MTSVALQRASFSGEERATITAGLINRSADAGDESAGQARDRRPRRRHTRPVTIAPNASGSVTFDAVTVAEANMRGADPRRHRRARRSDNDFYFVLSPSRPVSVLVIQAEGAGAVRVTVSDDRARRSSTTPPFKVDVVPAVARHARELRAAARSSS